MYKEKILGKSLNNKVSEFRIRMVMQSVGLHDTLRIKKCSGTGITLSTEQKELKNPQENLAVRAINIRVFGSNQSIEMFINIFSRNWNPWSY